MIIVDHQIKALCHGNIPWYLSLGYLLTGNWIGRKTEPMVEPFNPRLVNPASIDIRIGNTAQLRVKDGYENIDLTEFSAENPFWIVPGDRVLVGSLETFNLPSFIGAQFKLKSSRAREFYQHGFAGWCDPKWHGSKLTMELFNADVERLPLYPGLKIGQLIFSLTFGLPEKDYSITGRYNNDKGAEASKG